MKKKTFICKRVTIFVVLLLTCSCAQPEEKIVYDSTPEMQPINILSILSEYVYFVGPDGYGTAKIDNEKIDDLILYSKDDIKISCEVKYDNPEIVVYKNDEVVAMSYLTFDHENLHSNEVVRLVLNDSVNNYLSRYFLYIPCCGINAGILSDVISSNEKIPEGFETYIDVLLEEYGKERSDYAFKKEYERQGTNYFLYEKDAEISNVLVIELVGYFREENIFEYDNWSHYPVFLKLYYPYIVDGSLTAVSYEFIDIDYDVCYEGWKMCEIEEYLNLVADENETLVEVEMR